MRIKIAPENKEAHSKVYHAKYRAEHREERRLANKEYRKTLREMKGKAPSLQYRYYTPAEDARILEVGIIVPNIARELGRTTASVYTRRIKLRRAMSVTPFAEDGYRYVGSADIVQHLPTTGRYSMKFYTCTVCDKFTAFIGTNHWGFIYGHYCQRCHRWTSPWRCDEPVPPSYSIPEKWQQVKLGDVVTVR